MISKKRKLKRNVRFESLDRSQNPKVRWEHLDADYLNKLSPEELRWYAQFIDESIGGSISKDKRGVPKVGHLHNTRELAKKCTDANNYRNNDLFSVGKANGFISSIDKELNDENDGWWYVRNPELTELYVIYNLDEKNNPEELTFKEYIQIRNNVISSVRDRLDAKFIKLYPKAYMYYHAFNMVRITDGKLDKLLKKPKLLENFIQNAEFMKRKKNRTD